MYDLRRNLKMKEKTKLVCLDRDGTINKDDNYYLGSAKNWREQIEFLPGVIDGIRLFNSRGLDAFILTNQSGVALEDKQFADLTDERMYEVNRVIIEMLKQRGALVRGYFACPFVDSKYAETALAKGRRVNPKYIWDDCDDLKPKIGMIEKAAQALGRKLDSYDVYMIGDRLSDVQMGLNAGGTGILIASKKTSELGDSAKVEQLRSQGRRVYIAKDFLDAARYVCGSR